MKCPSREALPIASEHFRFMDGKHHSPDMERKGWVYNAPFARLVERGGSGFLGDQSLWKQTVLQLPEVIKVAHDWETVFHISRQLIRTGDLARPKKSRKDLGTVRCYFRVSRRM